MSPKKISHKELYARKPSIETLKEEARFPIYVLLENIRSIYNVGSFFRTAESIRAAKVFLCGYTASPPRKEISKTALGADQIVPYEYAENAVEIIKKLKKEGVQIIALEIAHESVDYSRATYNFPVCLIVGNEISGISDEVMKEVDMAIDIPMFGRANSLNVAVAGGIALSAICKQYTSDENPYRTTDAKA